MNHKELIEQEELKADGKELIEEVKSCLNCYKLEYCSINSEMLAVANGYLFNYQISCSLHERKSNNE